MATDTTKLQRAYQKYNEALEQQGKANVREYENQKAQTAYDTGMVLQNAYINNQRASYRQGQLDRAAGISGGLAVNERMARDNLYNNSRTAAILAQERANTGYDIGIEKAKAQTYSAKTENAINKENTLHSIAQNDADGVRSVYASMLSNKYIPQSSSEAQKMADSLGVPLSSLQAYINYMKNN